MKTKLILKGIGTYIPGIAAYRAKGTGGTNIARYCYSVWLRHLVMAYQNGLCRESPRTIVELGPGDSLGTGLAAYLTGTERYYGLDVVRHASIEKNLAVLDELVTLFRRQENIPGVDEFPRVRPILKSYEFPSSILPREALAKLLAPKRIERLRRSILQMDEPASVLGYVTGSARPESLPSQSVDMIFSQAVLEYVEPLPDMYQLMARWLRSGGFVSHQIDFSCHGLAEDWNGHWSYSDRLWKVIRGKRVWFINRVPHSTHLRLIEQAGLRVVCDIKVQEPATNSETCLAPRFAGLSPEDRITRGAFIQATKPG